MAKKAKSKAKSKAKAKEMALDTDEGTVDGIDVFALPGQPVVCFAFIVRQPGDDFQVVTYEARLQSALELASSKQCRVEVYFEDDGNLKVLYRVRLLDR